MKKIKQKVREIRKLIRHPLVRYENIWLRILASFLVAQMIVHILRQKSGLASYLLIGYHIAWIVTFAVALLIMQWVYCSTVYLDHTCSWTESAEKRIKKQILLGVGGALLIDFVFMSIYFRSIGSNIFYTGWPTLYLPITLFMLATLNFYYYGRYKVVEKKEQQEKAREQRLLKTTAEQTVKRLTEEKETILFYYLGEKGQVLAASNLRNHIPTLFKALTEIDLTTGEFMAPGRNCRVAWANIKSVKKLDRRFVLELYHHPEGKTVEVSKELSAVHRKRLNTMLS